MAPGLVRSRWDGGALPAHSPLPLGWWKLATGFSNETLPAPLPRSLRAPHRTLATYPHLIPAGGNTTSGATIKSKFPPHSSCVHVKAECLSLPPLQHCRVFTNNDQELVIRKILQIHCPTVTNYLELPKGHRLQDW